MTKRRLMIGFPDIIMALCFILVCITGHEGTGVLSSILRYCLFALLAVEAIGKGIKLTRSISFFLVSTALAMFLNLLFHVFSTFSGPHYYDAFSSIRAVLFYCMFLYCGYYIAYTFGETDKLFRWIHNISFFAAIVIIGQYVLKLAGIYLNRIPIVGEYIFHAVDNQWYFRPCAFFSEPSYFAEIAILDIYINLFIKRNIHGAVVDLIAITISTSALGIVFGFGILVWWIVSQRVVKSQILNALIKIFLVLAFSYVLVFLFVYAGDNRAINRLMNGATIRQRTFRAFEIYGTMDMGERIFGIGMQNLTNYLNANSITLVNDGADTLVNKEFAQSFGYVLCSLGVTGWLGFFSIIVSSIYEIKRGRKIIAAVFLGLSLTASLITRQYFSLYLAVIYTVIIQGHIEDRGTNM